MVGASLVDGTVVSGVALGLGDALADVLAGVLAAGDSLVVTAALGEVLGLAPPPAVPHAVRKIDSKRAPAIRNTAFFILSTFPFRLWIHFTIIIDV